MNILHFLKCLWIGAIIGFLAYAITAGICDWYLSELKRTGEMVMAKDVLYTRFAPWLFGILGFAGTFVVMGKKEGEK